MTTGVRFEPVRVQWELRRALARADQSLGHYDDSVRAHVDRRFPRVTAFQAAFRASTGRSRSASRYSMRNGRTIGTSPGLPRGGGIAERCAGVRPK